jgi:hypothetical protein
MVQVQEYRRALQRIRDSARLLAETPPAGPNRLKKIDALLGALLRSGCTPREAVEASYHLNNLVVGFAADIARADAWFDRTGMTAADLTKLKQDFARALRVDLYPNLAPMADLAGFPDPDPTFKFGVDLLLDGLAARVASRSAPRVKARRDHHPPSRRGRHDG